MTTAVAAMDAPTPLQTVLTELRVSQAALSRAVGLARSTVCDLVRHGRWPSSNTDDTRRLVLGHLIGAGATARHLALMRQAGIGGTSGTVDAQLLTSTEDEMLLANERLKPDTIRHFNLTRDPFHDDVNTRADVWQSPATRYVRNALMDCAMHHGFVAVVGESGSGKTTLREELEERIHDERRPVIVIKPYVLGMEPDDLKGKRMKAGQIAESIARALAPSVQLKSSPEARFGQVHKLLADSCAAGSRHLVVIEEAHRMPIATLKHLKGFMELKTGLRRLLGVCLIGQPELGALLGEQRPEIREIVQRCEVLRMHPLDADLGSYLKHKFSRAEVDVSAVLDESAIDAIKARLVWLPRGGKAADAVSICYPLAAANLLSRAMNAAAAAGWPRVDAAVIGEC